GRPDGKYHIFFLRFLYQNFQIGGFGFNDFTADAFYNDILIEHYLLFSFALYAEYILYILQRNAVVSGDETYDIIQLISEQIQRFRVALCKDKMVSPGYFKGWKRRFYKIKILVVDAVKCFSVYACNFVIQFKHSVLVCKS